MTTPNLTEKERPMNASITPPVATESFLAAWEQAGKPPVQLISYPRSGRSTSTALFSHREITITIPQGRNGTFEDDGRFCSLEWQFTPQMFGAVSATMKLIFDREEPIQIGRRAR